MDQSRARNGFVAFKIDLEKAYVRVRWDFLEEVLRDFGFPSKILSFIMWGIRFVSLSIVWNGAKTEAFHPTCGLC